MSKSQPLPPGLVYLPDHFDADAQAALVADIRSVVVAAPLFVPEMPRTGKPMSVRMTNCGPLGWVTDRTGGYRYQPTHPVTGDPWPAIPKALIDLWTEVSGCGRPPEACLVNFYDDTAKMGLHQDRDETDFSAPVVSVSLGDQCLFRIGAWRATIRHDPSGCRVAMSWCSAARAGSSSTASTGSIPALRRF